MGRPLNLCLITLGDPGKLTGGYLYHQRMSGAAERYGARLRFISVPERSFPLAMLSGGRALATAMAQGPDVVLVDSIAAAFLAPALARGRTLGILGVLHQPPGGVDGGPLGIWLRAALDLSVYRRAVILIVASELLGEEMVRHGFAPERLRVVPPGRDGAEVTSGHAAPVDLRYGRKAAFLCVANWLPNKEIDLLLESFAMLAPDAGTLHLVGDGKIDRGYAARIVRRLARADLKDRVQVHGSLAPAGVAAFYRSADVFVLASKREAYGTVYGEAMAAGLPVIGLTSGNLPNLVTPGKEGILVAPGDVPGLARALVALAHDEERRRSMGEAARLRAAGLPTWEQSAAAFFAAVKETVT